MARSDKTNRTSLYLARLVTGWLDAASGMALVRIAVRHTSYCCRLGILATLRPELFAEHEASLSRAAPCSLGRVQAQASSCAGARRPERDGEDAPELPGAAARPARPQDRLVIPSAAALASRDGGEILSVHKHTIAAG
ncbi:hypothetical protein AAFF_G00432480 [Aldrovandia affinis]|uniref:Uncharacterized protein n=1 Tax=Aldrovandia affinis TaxID=143900 RepID=A0AAD7WI50_9TELE|nr:hypothetical protein AAFF_G00432480 [Aldrovandia affinis]